MTDLVLHELTPSPNNIKVRIALAYKGLAYERKPLDMSAGFPGDRSKIVALSGQPRTPVLEHGSTVLFDSNAILRYLEANFKGTPPLFSDDYARFGEIERWELHARTEVGKAVGVIFEQIMGQMQGGTFDPGAGETASRLLSEATASIEETLAGGDWLVGDHLTSADIANAPLINLSLLDAAAIEGSPIASAFAAHFHLGDGRDRTRAWVRRVMDLDPVTSGQTASAAS